MSAGPLPQHGASAADIRHHYDLSNDFYALWLDPSLTYSCALWDGPQDTLSAAQERKLDYLAGLARARGAKRVLDVGCGWGSMLRRLLEAHGVERTVGLTLSDVQAKWVAGWADERCLVRLESWNEHQPEQTYDAIVSIGAFEHFAGYGVPRSERVAAYREFFESCRRWLPRGGRLALQTITKGSNVRLDREMVQDGFFVIERIFPGSELPWPSEMLQASERRFEVASIRNDAAHYGRTAQAWLDGLRANRDRAVGLVGEQAVADYERYLSLAVRSFANAHLGLMRVAFERVI